MLATCDTGEGDFLVGKVGGGNDDGVDVLVIGNLVEIGRILGGTPFVLALVKKLFIRVTDRSQLTSGVDPDPGNMMKIGNQTGPDNRDANFFVCHFDLS